MYALRLRFGRDEGLLAKGLDLGKARLRKRRDHLLHAVGALDVVFHKAAVSAVGLAHEEGNVHLHAMALSVQPVFPQIGDLVALLAEKASPNSVSSL